MVFIMVIFFNFCKNEKNEKIEKLNTQITSITSIDYNINSIKFTMANMTNMNKIVVSKNKQSAKYIESSDDEIQSLAIFEKYKLEHDNYKKILYEKFYYQVFIMKIRIDVGAVCLMAVGIFMILICVFY